jgi:hypothetical protein
MKNIFAFALLIATCISGSVFSSEKMSSSNSSSSTDEEKCEKIMQLIRERKQPTSTQDKKLAAMIGKLSEQCQSLLMCKCIYYDYTKKKYAWDDKQIEFILPLVSSKSINMPYKSG